ncbi:hypothetical protein ACI5KX_12610 [Erythrobacter sp. GH1-10]|uniref:hypothetical protein n=1 Tax=Erythrobacter sp. GH1-10 TaxID=3349334 RepID=UPI003877FDC1
MRQAGRSIANPFGLKITTVAVAATLLGACATPAPLPPPPPPPPPPPAPVAEVIPFRPLPPGGAAYVMNIPAKDSYGRRETVNLDLTDDEKVWHFRSAWNVAALNCTAARYQPVLDAYSVYIKDHARALKRVNDRIDASYRREHGARRAGIVAREGQMTSVYNFFALPPARSGFCTAALDLSNRALAAPPSDPIAFALENFALLEQPFSTFFDEYEEYQQLSARWDAKYGANYGASQPGYLAVQNARNSGIEVPTVGESDPTETLASPTTPAGLVTDSETGESVPVVPVREDFVSQPVVEPIPNAESTDASTQDPTPTPRGMR